MKNFLYIRDIPLIDLKKIISAARKRKKKRKGLSLLDPDKDNILKGKFLIQMFEKSSLRTRLSFYLAIKQLGGGTLTLRSDELHLSKRGESIGDTAKIISSFSDKKKIKLTIINKDNQTVTTLYTDNAKPFVKRYKFIKGFEEGSLDFCSIKKNNQTESTLKIYDFKLKELPVLIGEPSPDTISSPTDNPSGEIMYLLSPSAYKTRAMFADLLGSYSIVSTFAGIPSLVLLKSISL